MIAAEPPFPLDFYPLLRARHSQSAGQFLIVFGAGHFGGHAMQWARVGEDHPVARLVHVEWVVREISELVDRQRKRIEKLQESRSDLTSAKIVLDSLMVSLTLHLHERDQLRAMFNAEMAEVFSVCRNATAEARSGWRQQAA